MIIYQPVAELATVLMLLKTKVLLYLFQTKHSIEFELFYLVEEKGHEAKKEGYKEGAQEKGVIGQIGDTLSNAYHYVAEKVSEATSGASYEANKEKVKDSDNTVGERVGAGFSAVGDKIEEKAHKGKAEAHKEAL
jgi:hypothetical protein